MMKTFRAFVKKEFLHILRDRRTLLVLFGMPVAQIILFGYAINTEVRRRKWPCSTKVMTCAAKPDQLALRLVAIS
jgi:hypothetical protein